MKTCTKCHKDLPDDQFYPKRPDCKLCKKAVCRIGYRANRLSRLVQKKEYYAQNKQKILEYKQEYYKENIDLIKIKRQKYYLENKPAIRKRKRECTRKRYLTDTNFKIREILRCSILRAIKTKKCTKKAKTMSLLGCTIEFVRSYIESLFKPEMSWKNHGQWEVDHIIPVSAFDLSDVNEQYKCFNYTNLQPLWRAENRLKSDFLPNGERARYCDKL
jgi:hypothetical protein